MQPVLRCREHLGGIGKDGRERPIEFAFHAARPLGDGSRFHAHHGPELGKVVPRRRDGLGRGRRYGLLPAGELTRMGHHQHGRGREDGVPVTQQRSGPPLR